MPMGDFQANAWSDLYEKWEGNASSRTGEGGREVVQGSIRERC